MAAAALSAAASSSIAAAMASSLQNGSSAQTAVVNSNISINYSNANANNDEEAESETTIKHQKYFSGIFETHQNSTAILKIVKLSKFFKRLIYSLLQYRISIAVQQCQLN